MTEINPVQSDFKAQYDAACSPVDSLQAQVLTFEQFRQVIKDQIEEDGEHEGRVLLLGFARFGAFFNWFDTLNAYEARDADDLTCYRAMLEPIYASLVQEYSAVKACPFCGEHESNLSNNGIESNFVVCNCGAEGPPGKDDTQAIIEWNRRAQLPGPGIAGYQVHTPDGDHWADRPSFLILSEVTAINDLREARKGQGQWLMTVVLDGDIENPEFEVPR